MIAAEGAAPASAYFEVSLLGEWRPRLPAAAAALRDTNRSSQTAAQVGLKIRCGGLDADAVPESFAVAAAIATAQAIGVPLKATQGLHHPFRHHDPALGTEVHGFLNLFVASILARAHDLPVTALVEIVNEMEPTAFTFSAEKLAWRDLEASSEDVAAARASLLGSFGSCSFSEPRDDLQACNIV
jgi:hypothetical protein